MRVALDLKKQDKVEYLVEKALPTGDSYDDWTVLVDHHRVRAYTLYTGYNRIGNKKYANFCISFEVVNPTDVRVNYMDVREWIEENGIDHLVHDEVVAALRKIDVELAQYVSLAKDYSFV